MRDKVFTILYSWLICAALCCGMLPACIFAAEPKDASSWTEVQELIDTAENGEIITLTKDIKAKPEDKALTVPADKKIILDLNGHTIDRALKKAEEDGSAVIVDGELTITGNGVITGGNTVGRGGGVLVNGIFIMENGTITGNNASGSNSSGKGGGVYVGKSFVMKGGSIILNSSENNGAGVYFDRESSFWISGSIKISGNYRYDEDRVRKGNHNVYAGGGARITFEGSLSGATSVGISAKDKEKPFTFGLSENGKINNFTSDDPEYAITESQGEAVLSQIVTEGDDSAGAEPAETPTPTPRPTMGIAEYSVVQGNDGSWKKGSQTDYTLVVERSANDDETYSRFESLQMDGIRVSSSNYEIRQGSLIIDLRSGYLETLTAGKHTLSVRFNDATALATLYIQVAASPTIRPVKQEPTSAPEAAVSESPAGSISESQPTPVSEEPAPDSGSSKTDELEKSGRHGGSLLLLLLLLGGCGGLIAARAVRNKRKR